MTTWINRTSAAYVAALVSFAVLLSHPDVTATDGPPQRLACASPAPASAPPGPETARAH